jgi:NTP pyrophosphatase (non-canonical NTP hydrolase)
MSKEIKGFVTRDDFITSGSSDVAPLYELSDIALTYSKNKTYHFSSLNSLYSLHVFKTVSGGNLTQDEVEDVLAVIIAFSNYLTTTMVSNKQQILILFANEFNSSNITRPITNLAYNVVMNYNNVKAPDYLTFTVSGVTCSIWLSDTVFRAFYSDYDVNVILPFANFAAIVNSPTDIITALDNFDLVAFNLRVEANKNELPTTYTKFMNVQYKVPNTSVLKNCYFGFNIYGLQGNYDHILKLELYNYITNTLGITGAITEALFPTILNINEFFITPRWDKVAIPAQIGQVGITSQVASAFNETFDLNKFIKVFADVGFIRTNTYSVPFAYNNLLLHATNGYYTESSVQDFRAYYSDLISANSTDPDFSRMSTRTQKFVTMLSNMLEISNATNATEMFNKILQNTDYRFTIIARGGVSYISCLYEDHQYYVIPKYSMLSNL